MRLTLVMLAAVGLASTAGAQNAAGAWDYRFMIGPKDSAIAAADIKVSGDQKTWTLVFPDRPPIPMRVLATGGDSVVTDAGPYASTKRPGQSVTLLHMVSHFDGNHLTGTFEAHYSGGLVVQGKTDATRKP